MCPAPIAREKKAVFAGEGLSYTPIVFGSLSPDQVAHHDILLVSMIPVQPLKQTFGADNAFDKGRKLTG